MAETTDVSFADSPPSGVYTPSEDSDTSSNQAQPGDDSHVAHKSFLHQEPASSLPSSASSPHCVNAAESRSRNPGHLIWVANVARPEPSVSFPSSTIYEMSDSERTSMPIAVEPSNTRAPPSSDLLELETISDSDSWIAIDSETPTSQPDQAQPASNAASGLQRTEIAPLHFGPHPIPKPCNPPTYQDWQFYRPVFTRLYCTEGKSLKETKTTLKERYGFSASDRMFKQRITEWNLRKNYSSRQEIVGQNEDFPISHDATNHPSHTAQSRRGQLGKSANFSSTTSVKSGLPLSQTRSRNGRGRIARKSHTSYLESYLRSQELNLSLTRFRTISEDLSNVETLLTLIDHYCDSYFHAAWKRTYPSPPRFTMREMPLCINLTKLLSNDETPNVVHPTSVFNRYQIAAVLFEDNTPEATQAAWRFIGQAFDILKDVLIQQHPQLLSSFFDQYYSSQFNAHPELTRQLFYMSAEFANIHFGERHPITKLCRLLPRCAHRLDVVLLAWQRLFDSFHAKLGVSHEEVLRSKMALCGALIERGKYLEAEELLQFILSNHDRPLTDYWVRAARCRLGWLLVIQQRHAEAEEVLQDLAERYKGYAGAEEVPIDAIYIASLSLRARSHSDRKQFDQAETILGEALDLCVPLFGSEHGFSTSVMAEMDKLTKLRTAATGSG